MRARASCGDPGGCPACRALPRPACRRLLVRGSSCLLCGCVRAACPSSGLNVLPRPTCCLDPPAAAAGCCGACGWTCGGRGCSTSAGSATACAARWRTRLTGGGGGAVGAGGGCLLAAGPPLLSRPPSTHPTLLCDTLLLAPPPPPLPDLTTTPSSLHSRAPPPAAAPTTALARCGRRPRRSASHSRWRRPAARCACWARCVLRAAGCGLRAL